MAEIVLNSDCCLSFDSLFALDVLYNHDVASCNEASPPTHYRRPRNQELVTTIRYANMLSFAKS